MAPGVGVASTEKALPFCEPLSAAKSWQHTKGSNKHHRNAFYLGCTQSANK
jgi:hypothetical protein